MRGVWILLSFWSLYSLAEENKPIRILSIDGGGVRGVIPAVLLHDLEMQLQKPVIEIFDMITGSSVGGIIALGLTAPNIDNKPLHSALDVANFFIDHRKDIFKTSFSNSLRTLGGLIGPQYQSDGFSNILKETLGDIKLSQLLIPTLITGYHVDGNVGIEFFSLDAQKFPEEMDCLAREVGLATAAAPCYFDSVDIHYDWGVLPSVADGCLYKISPAMLPFIRAQKLYPGKTIEIYSLGTGQSIAENINLNLKNRGIIHWLNPLLKHIWLASINADDSILSKMLNNDEHKNYFRINPRIDIKHSALDDISDDNLAYLLMIAASLKNSLPYKEMLNKLKNT